MEPIRSERSSYSFNELHQKINKVRARVLLDNHISIQTLCDLLICLNESVKDEFKEIKEAIGKLDSSTRFDNSSNWAAVLKVAETHSMEGDGSTDSRV